MPEDDRSTLSDADLHAACLRGDQAAWDTLVDRYGALIYSIPLRYGLPEADAGDVFQAVCMTLLEKLGTVRDPRRLAAWIITTTTRESWALARTRGRDLPLPQPSGERVAGNPTPGHLEMADDSLPLPEVVERLERQYMVRVAVERLPEPCRRLVQALFTDTADRLTYQALASSLGIPLNSLGPTRARCLARLRKLLEDVGYTS